MVITGGKKCLNCDTVKDNKKKTDSEKSTRPNIEQACGDTTGYAEYPCVYQNKTMPLLQQLTATILQDQFPSLMFSLATFWHRVAPHFCQHHRKKRNLMPSRLIDRLPDRYSTIDFYCRGSYSNTVLLNFKINLLDSHRDCTLTCGSELTLQ